MVETILNPNLLPAQETDPKTTAAILERLDRLEKQNAELLSEISALRAELSTAKSPGDSATPPLQDRVDVLESRVDEQAQAKVDASQRFPIAVKGLLLFNAFSNTRTADASLGTTYLLNGPERSGATMAQTLLGFEFNGPEIFGDGKISAALSLDFGNSPNAYSYGLTFRRAVIDADWRKRSVMVGVDKALISQRAPDSLAEVTFPALSDAGNPWIWVPQVRYTERLQIGENAGIDVAGSLLQTSETTSYYTSYVPPELEAARPGFESRVNFWKQSDSDKKFEIAAGFHTSNSHFGDHSIPSRFGTVDWLIKPARWVEFTGLFLGGENVAVLGGFANGITQQPATQTPEAIRSLGGWTQVAFPVTSRLTFHVFGGLQAPHVMGLNAGSLTQEFSYAANAFYRLAPNVLLSAEALQERALFLDQSRIIRNHYDLAIGYLF